MKSVVVIIIIIFLVIKFFAWIGRETGAQSGPTGPAVPDGGLAVRCQSDQFVPEDGGPGLPVKQIIVSGNIIVPHDNYAAQICIRLLDITESTEDPYPIFCMIPDLCDDDGIFEMDQELTVPHQHSAVADMQVAGLPIFALVGPRQGQRRLKVMVGVAASHDTDTLYAYGDSTFYFSQESAGYLEIAERTKQNEKQIAMLALAMSAVDGNIDPSESTAIRRYFRERYAGLDDAQSRKDEISKTLKETLTKIKSATESPEELISRLCGELREQGDEVAVQSAYELCVQVVAADGIVDQNEQLALNTISERLGLPPKFMREAHDRHLRLSMYEEAEEAQAIDMPAGLTREEKLAFLNKEYRRWRGRVTHKDSEIATEASLRLEKITKLRRQITDA